MDNMRANEFVTDHVDDAVVDSICDAFESTWKSGRRPRIEDYLQRAGEAERTNLLVELILIEFELRRGSGESPSMDEYLERFPNESPYLRDRLLRELETAGLAQSSIEEPLIQTLSAGETWGRYQLLSLLGRGGFGEVWRARDPVLSREVALKTLRPDKPVSVHLNQELVREGQRIAQLSDSRIVRVLDAGIANGRAFLVSELKEGGTLTSRLSDRNQVDFETAVRWMIEVALALQSAHEQGFVHRDLKPGNLLFDLKGNIAVADFGLAVSELDQLTEPAGMMGTWAYASPEQARGEARLADPRSDLYSLGVIFYQLLTGRLPFVAQTVAQFRQQIQEREPRPPRTRNPDIPIELETICLSCLRKEVANRPSSAREVADALQRWLDSNRPQSISKSPPLGGIPLWKVWSAGILMICLFVAVAAFMAQRFGALNANPVPKLEDWQNPIVRVRNIHDAQVDRHGFDAESGRYQFDTLGESFFQVGTCEGDELTLHGVFHIHGHARTGRAGVFWGWAPVSGDARIASCCWGIEVGRISPDTGDRVLIHQYNIGPSSGGHHVVLDGSHSLRTVELSDLRSSKIDLRAVVTAQRVQQIYVNGEPVLKEPVDLKDDYLREWQVLYDGGYGFMGFLGTVSVEAFSAESTDK